MKQKLKENKEISFLIFYHFLYFLIFSFTRNTYQQKHK